ncbi:MAG: hypothetical protein AB1489_05965 [Acidobacteriota bacterium]
MSIVYLLLLFLLLNGLLLILGIGVGYLLNWLLSVDLSIGILTGVVTTGISLYFFGKILMAMPPGEDEDIEEIEEGEFNRLVRDRLTLMSFPRKPKRRRRN